MNNDETLLSVLGERNIEAQLTQAETAMIKRKLWDVLQGRVESYTLGGSSSVRVETARELLKSAGFVLRCGIGNDAGPEEIRALLVRGDFDALFRAGLRELEARVDAGRALLKTAEETATAVHSRAYENTLRELGVFFQRYHIHHFAHETPCMLDYPLSHPVDEALLGIDYISEYLRRLIIENEFTGRFNPLTVTALLKSASPDYKEDLLNIYEMVAANALALALLGGDVTALDVTDADRARLLARLSPWAEKTAPIKLRAASAGLCAVLDIPGGPAREYLELTAAGLCARLKPALRNGRLERVFPSLYQEKEEKKQEDFYIDNPPMDDEALRALINALTSCRFLSDKLALVHRHVSSLWDLTELLDICFWGEEQAALFNTLPDAALTLLRRVAEGRSRSGWRSETDWETKLGDYRRKQ